MTGAFGDYFDSVYVISLEQRADRRARLGDELTRLGLADSEDITWMRAVSGEKCWAPGFFAAGAGAWGCLQSHLRILQDAIMDGRERILVLEDDATFHENSVAMLELFFRQVPGDWGQVFLGGEHAEPPELIKHRPFVLKGKCVHRTHAFALKGEVLPMVYQHIANYPDYMNGGQWHVDHQLGQAHQLDLWNTYAPSWWIAGQCGGSSDISAKKNPDYWWHPGIHVPQLPFIWAPATGDTSEEWLEVVHFGNHLIPGTLQDEGLEKCLEDDQELSEWLAMIAAEAIELGKLPGVHHPGIELTRCAGLWSGPFRNISEYNPEDLAGFPFIDGIRHPGEVKRLGRCLARQ
ncbi:MAG: glycosyltransferase family 25 protein [Verrucomicrobiae bacterium]|nr:glycosyltransferase family 25 protein [Verrucomicrobiae bacterium]